MPQKYCFATTFIKFKAFNFFQNVLSDLPFFISSGTAVQCQSKAFCILFAPLFEFVFPLLTILLQAKLPFHFFTFVDYQIHSCPQSSQLYHFPKQYCTIEVQFLSIYSFSVNTCTKEVLYQLHLFTFTVFAKVLFIRLISGYPS